MPPLATSAEAYGAPTWPVPPAHSRPKGGGVIVMPQPKMIVSVILPAASTTCAAYEKVPTLVGVPEMTPLVALSVKPGGNDPEMIEKV